MKLTNDEQQFVLSIAHYLIAAPNHPQVFRSSAPPCIHEDILSKLFGRALTTFTLRGVFANRVAAMHPVVEGGVYLTAQTAVGLLSQRILQADYLHLVSDMPPPDGILLEDDAPPYTAEEVQAVLSQTGADLDLWAIKDWRTASFLS